MSPMHERFRRNHRAANRLRFQPCVVALESRLAPATASLSNGVLTINYTATGSTNENVSVFASTPDIYLSGNITYPNSFPLASVNKIVVQDAGGGTKQSLGVNLGTSQNPVVLSGGFVSTGIDTVGLGNMQLVGNAVVDAPSAINWYSNWNSPGTLNGDVQLTSKSISIAYPNISGNLEVTANSISVGSSSEPPSRISLTVGNKLSLSSTGSLTLANTITATNVMTLLASGTLLQRSGTIQVPAGGLSGSGAVINLAGDNVSANGNITLASVGEYVSKCSVESSTGSLEVSAQAISVPSGSLTAMQSIDLNSAGAITVGGFVNSPGVVWLDAPGQTCTFQGNGNSAGTLIIPTTVTAIIDGTFTSSGFVQVDGTIAGHGSVGQVSVLNNGQINPGLAIRSALATGNVAYNPNTIYHVAIGGPNPGLDQDQLFVTGSINLGDAQLQSTISLTPNPGQVFKIIDNDDADAVIGTFGGLPEGSTVTIGSVDFTISYHGGDGNDVTLTSTTLTSSPPRVTSVIFGDGRNQRSMVRQVVVGFSEVVNFTGNISDAITLYRSGPAGTTGNVAFAVTPAAGPTSAVTMTFGQAGYAGNSQKRSLENGFYALTINAALVVGSGGGSLDGDANGVGGDDYFLQGTIANKFYRLYGDVNGNGIVDLEDFGKFLSIWSVKPGFSALDFDFDYSGTASLNDFAEFRSRFNIAL